MAGSPENPFKRLNKADQEKLLEVVAQLVAEHLEKGDSLAFLQGSITDGKLTVLNIKLSGEVREETVFRSESS